MVVAILLAVEVARLTVAARVSESDPQLAERLAPMSPPALASLAMADVGESAAKGTDLSRKTRERLRDLAAIAPLNVEPFLVEGALATREGQLSRAEQLLRQARHRNPRSTAAQYLLADVSLRQGNVEEGLKGMSVLTRLLPATAEQLVPALAQYARTPGAPEQLRSIVERNPQLKPPLLEALAANPDEADLVLALAGSDIRSGDRKMKHWKTKLLNGFIERGEYRRAYEVWRRFAGLQGDSSPLLFNGDFRESIAPPPFNWRLHSGAAGLAELQDGKLRALHYGRQDSRLAAQMLLLPPGRYRFRAAADGRLAEGALKWGLTCVSGQKQIMSVPVGSASGASFIVPNDCPAQVLALNGTAQETPETSDVRVGPVAVERIGA